MTIELNDAERRFLLEVLRNTTISGRRNERDAAALMARLDSDDGDDDNIIEGGGITYADFCRNYFPDMIDFLDRDGNEMDIDDPDEIPDWALIKAFSISGGAAQVQFASFTA